MREETNSGGMKRTVRLLKPHVSPGLKEEPSIAMDRRVRRANLVGKVCVVGFCGVTLCHRCTYN